MKRRLVNDLHSIYELLLSSDVECKILGLITLKNHPIWANKNKHFNCAVQISETFGLIGKTWKKDRLKKSIIDELIIGTDVNDEYSRMNLNYWICIILNYLQQSTNRYYSERKSRFTYKGVSALSSNYNGRGVKPSVEYKHKFKQKIKNKESKHHTTRQRWVIKNVSRKEYLGMLDIFSKEYVISTYKTKNSKPEHVGYLKKDWFKKLTKSNFNVF